MSTRTKPQPARNYGARDQGGDAYAMGREVNRMMCVYWQAYQQDLKAMRAAENPFLREHHRYNIENRWKVALRLFCCIRKAGRGL